MSGAASGTVTATYGADTSIDSFVNVNNISGSAFADTFNGGDGTQGFFGGAGDDVIHGGDGGDFLMGDLGADVLDGGTGFDTVLYR